MLCQEKKDNLYPSLVRGRIMEKEKKQYASCLIKVPIFNHLNEIEQESVVELIDARKVNKDSYLYHQGEKKSHLYVVHQGKIKISRYNEDGNEQVIRILFPGDFLGDESLFSNKETDNFAVALEESRVCVLDGDQLKKHIARNPEIGIRIIHELSQRLSELESKIESYSLESVNRRVASSILRLSLGKKVFELPFSKKDWASMLGMNQATLSRKLSQFKKDRLIDLKEQRKIVILNKEKLETIR